VARLNRERLARQVAALRQEVDDAAQKLAARNLRGIAYVDAELARIGGLWRWQEIDAYHALQDARLSYGAGFPWEFVTDRVLDWIQAAARRQPEPPVSLPPGWEHVAPLVAWVLRDWTQHIREAPSWRDWQPAQPDPSHESPEWRAAMDELHDRIAWGLPLRTDPLSVWEPGLPAEDVAALIAEAEDVAAAEERRTLQPPDAGVIVSWRSKRTADGYP
jgi:hypothetical protein